MRSSFPSCGSSRTLCPPRYPGLVPASKSGEYTLLCAELLRLGHYKMKAKLVARPEAEHLAYLQELAKKQNYDGVPEAAAEVAKGE